MARIKVTAIFETSGYEDDPLDETGLTLEAFGDWYERLAQTGLSDIDFKGEN